MAHLQAYQKKLNDPDVRTYLRDIALDEWRRPQGILVKGEEKVNVFHVEVSSTFWDDCPARCVRFLFMHGPEDYVLLRYGRGDSQCAVWANEDTGNYHARCLEDFAPTCLIPHLLPSLRLAHQIRFYLHDNPDKVLTREELDYISSKLEFGHDNRAGMNGSLHRISRVVNRNDRATGVTMRIGRCMPGITELIKDLIQVWGVRAYE